MSRRFKKVTSCGRNLPQTSKYRQVGKKDAIQTFDALKHYGANEARFRNYMNLCLANKFRTIYSRGMKDALCRPANLSLGEKWKVNTSVP